MSVKIMGMVWDLKKSQVNRDEKYILLAYADHASHDGTNIFPAVATIAEKTGYSERSVQMITRSLNRRGFLVPDGSGPHGTNKWRVPISGGMITPESMGAEIAPPAESALEGCKTEQPGVQESPERGAEATAPDSALTVLKPSREPLTENETKIYRAWRTFMDWMSIEMPKASFNNYLRRTVVVGREADTITIGAQDQNARDWLEARLTSTAERQLIGSLDEMVKIKFVVTGDLEKAIIGDLKNA